MEVTISEFFGTYKSRNNNNDCGFNTISMSSFAYLLSLLFLLFPAYGNNLEWGTAALSVPDLANQLGLWEKAGFVGTIVDENRPNFWAVLATIVREHYDIKAGTIKDHFAEFAVRDIKHPHHTFRALVEYATKQKRITCLMYLDAIGTDCHAHILLQYFGTFEPVEYTFCLRLKNHLSHLLPSV